ncbi:MAG TPA: hypothetical protein VKA18_07535 [Alphaproteobacteria bacterium]|nr:hypothetical protein [Alphaproteobacteria bacterium]
MRRLSVTELAAWPTGQAQPGNVAEVAFIAGEEVQVVLYGLGGEPQLLSAEAMADALLQNGVGDMVDALMHPEKEGRAWTGNFY